MNKIQIEMSLNEALEYIKKAERTEEKEYISNLSGEKYWTPEYIIFKKDDKKIKLTSSDVEMGLKLTHEIKKIAKKVVESDFNIEVVAKYHEKVVQRSYCLISDSMVHSHRLFIKRNKFELLASEYCINNSDEIHEYCTEHNIIV